ncbi:MAG: aminotransferase class V-fold PLP-dependent enzyme [Nanoarchaeota archaeon]|nr:aminotransferase class V-fold PLP-dependent enzyme [Nanoarchaeota archaeon]
MANIELKSMFDFFRKNNLVYLDNAATTQVPDSVIRAVEQVLEYRGNPHRGAHIVAEKNEQWLVEARENIARFINSSDKEIVFTNNTTDSINLAVDAIAHIIEKGDEIILPISEHHSNMLPFEKLIRKGAKLKVVKLKDYVVDVDKLKKAISPKTKIVAINHVSNVLGGINPVEEIGKYLKENHPDIIYIVDGAQSVAHIPVDIKKIKCDVFAFSSHKMYGPCGVGVLFISKKIFPLLKPVRAGGGTVNSISMVDEEDYTDLIIDFKQGLIILEGGTPNTSNIVGLSKAIDFIRSIGFDEIQKHEHELTANIIERLKKIQGIKIHGSEKINQRTGVVSFSIDEFSTKEIGEYLDKRKIAIRYGSHCAFPLIDMLGTETVRVSFGVYNTEQDIEIFIQELQMFLDKKRGLIKNKNLEPLRNMNYYKNIFLANSKKQIIQKIKSAVYQPEETEIIVMAGHFLGIPDMQENKFYPSIKPLVPDRLHNLLDGFGMTTFPLFTWQFGCEIVKELKEMDLDAKLVTIANDTTGINELRLSPTNTTKKTAEDYRNGLLAEYKKPNIPKKYKELLANAGLKETDILSFEEEKFTKETKLRQRFKEFVEKNKKFFEGIINYTLNKDAWELSIKILDNQEIKTCRFDAFNSKTGGKFCIVEVCQFISELFGKAKGVIFDYTSQRVLSPKSKAKHKILVMLTPAMCDDAVTKGAELYAKLMLQEKNEGSFRFFNIPLGPDSTRYLATGAQIKYLSDKGTIEELDVDEEPEFPDLWRLAEYKLLYNPEEYVNEIEELFKNIGITKKSEILDTCVGPGFFCTELLEKGYNLKTADKSKEMIKPFLGVLKEKGIKHEVVQSTWLDLPKHFKKNSFDMLFNRGNTLIYAEGGWNEKKLVDKKKSLSTLKKTLQIYYDLLKKGGYLYVDKYRDSEVPTKKVVAKLNIKSTGEIKDIIFSVERKPEKNVRYAQMLLRDKKGKEVGLPNMAYDLTEDEMEDLLKEVGFSSIKKIKLRNEKHFVVWLAKK